MNEPGTYYILMADIINSRSKPGSLLMEDFKLLVNKIKNDKAGSFLSPPTITLGDEFQSIVTNLKDGIDIIIDIEETVIKEQYDFKLRYVLYFGNIETQVNPNRAYEMLGEGLTQARELLNRQKKNNDRITIQTQNKHGEVLNNLFKIYFFIIGNWKQNDFPLINLFIEEKDYKIVARKLERERSGIWRKEKSLHMEEYFLLKKIINQTIDL